MSELRAISTRADITPTRFQNYYTYGDFKGDPQKLMERYFDAFVYVANWGATGSCCAFRNAPSSCTWPISMRPMAVPRFRQVHPQPI